MNLHKLMLFLLLIGCGGTDPAPTDASPGRPDGKVQAQGPRILDFGIDKTEVKRPDDTITISAVVTDPDGIDDVIGGVLEDARYDVNIGAFTSSAQEGAYSITVRLEDLIERYNDITLDYAEDMSIQLHAKFFDKDGNEVTQTANLTYLCDHYQSGTSRYLVRIIEGRCQVAYSCSHYHDGLRCKAEAERISYDDACGGLGKTCGSCYPQNSCTWPADRKCACL